MINFHLQILHKKLGLNFKGGNIENYIKQPPRATNFTTESKPKIMLRLKFRSLCTLVLSLSLRVYFGTWCFEKDNRKLRHQ